MGVTESKKIQVPKFSAQRVCKDVVTPKQFNNAVQNIPTSAIFEKQFIWRPGQKGKILISFNENEGAWSYPGSYSNEYSYRGNPSMNLGWTDPPFTSFEFLGKTYNPSDGFECEYRNGCCDSQCADTCICTNCPPKEFGYRCPDNFVPGSVILHEFGHALGMMHEHQSDLFNTNKLVFDEAAVIKYQYCYDNNGPCPNCSRSYIENCLTNNTCDSCVRNSATTARQQVIDRYRCDRESCDYAGSRFDKNSIMKYWFDDRWFSSGVNPDPLPNYTLSEKDKEWISGFYPRKSRAIDQIGFPELTIDFVGGTSWQRAWVQKIVSEQIAPLTGIKWIMPDVIVDPQFIGSIQNRKTVQRKDIKVPLSSLNIALQGIKDPLMDDKLRVNNIPLKELRKMTEKNGGKVIEGFRRNKERNKAITKERNKEHNKVKERFQRNFTPCEIFGIIVAVLVGVWLLYLYTFY